MSHPRRTLAQLRAEKDARLRTVQEGIRLGKIMEDNHNHGFAYRCTVFEQLTVLLEKATRACVLVEHGTFFDRANAYRLTGTLHAELGRIGDKGRNGPGWGAPW